MKETKQLTPFYFRLFDILLSLLIIAMFMIFLFSYDTYSMLLPMILGLGGIVKLIFSRRCFKGGMRKTGSVLLLIAFGLFTVCVITLLEAWGIII